jgi:hypothetical protein
MVYTATGQQGMIDQKKKKDHGGLCELSYPLCGERAKVLAYGHTIRVNASTRLCLGLA